jgi:hypothetical protein
MYRLPPCMYSHFRLYTDHTYPGHHPGGDPGEGNHGTDYNAPNGRCHKRITDRHRNGKPGIGEL